MNYEQFYKSLNISDKDLQKYMGESKYEGYPIEQGGSVWTQEGKSIFSLIRHFKPKRILELGNFKGVSSNHILQAVEKNGFGEVTLLDIEDQIDYERIHNRLFNRVIENSLNYLSGENNIDFDFIVVDDCHEYEHVKRELELIYEKNKCSKYYLWAHDYFVQESYGCRVKSAWDQTENINKQKTYKVLGEESDCGFVFSIVGV